MNDERNTVAKEDRVQLEASYPRIRTTSDYDNDSSQYIYQLICGLYNKKEDDDKFEFILISLLFDCGDILLVDESAISLLCIGIIQGNFAGYNGAQSKI